MSVCAGGRIGKLLPSGTLAFLGIPLSEGAAKNIEGDTGKDVRWRRGPRRKHCAEPRWGVPRRQGKDSLLVALSPACLGTFHSAARGSA